ncbi:DUF418 domain-containing protein [Sphaerisporangium aureirubrum]|uniref:DUF418 domain-containing protein n=1 Tax=Sphaerisporangium aureirubrum TaxID=1544736 RepID=A0ABW1NH82_9ACTN
MDSTIRTGGTTSSTVKRITDVDGLRGFAVLGILAVNMLDLADPGRMEGATAFTSSLDVGVRAFVIGAGQLTFLTLFAFLFGYSFTLQKAGAEAENSSVVPRTIRRLVALIAIGALHMVFLWRGDILMLWGLLGLVLLALSGLRPKTALFVSIGVTVLGVLYQGFNVLTAEPEELAPGLLHADGQAALDATRNGIGDYVSFNLGTFSLEDLYMSPLQVPSMLAVFLLGYAAGRVHWLENDTLLDQWLPKIQLIGLAVGIPTGVALGYAEAQGGDFTTIPGLLGQIGVPFLIAGMAATLMRMSRRGSGVLRVLAPAGMMSLTNYIVQSVLMCLIFTAYGLALAGQVSPLGLLGITIVICAAQVAYSKWWVSHYRYGPLEWLLRFATYGRPPAMRR